VRILALDIGAKRIGVAISDALGVTAQGHSILERKEGEGLVERLKSIIKEEGVGELVVGLPLNMDGSYGPEARKAVNFADDLKQKLGVNVKLWDERMSTMEAERVMIQGGASRGKRKKRIDKLAAQIVLQSYLDSKK
jgi:putative Holliday junction resolvase